MLGSRWKHIACRAEVGSLQYMSQSKDSMQGELLITPETRSYNKNIIVGNDEIEG